MSSCLLAALALFASPVVSVAVAQRPVPAWGEAEENLPSARELARAKFEASRADIAANRRAMIDVARGAWEARFELYRAGSRDSTLDILLDASRRVLETELAVCSEKTERIAFHESFWEDAVEAEKIDQARYEAGRISIQDLAAAKYVRLEAEIQLYLARTDGKRLLPLPGGGRSVIDSEEFVKEEGRGTFKELARRKFQASRVDLSELKRARVEAARTFLEARFELYVAGARESTLYALIEARRNLIDAELDLANNETDRIDVLDWGWQLARSVERINRARFEAGRLGIQDLADSTYDRLDAEIRLVQALAKRPRGTQLKQRAAQFPVGMEGIDRSDYPKLRAALANANPRRLARERLDAARVAHEARWKLFVAGARDSTQEMLISTSLNLLEAELAVCDQDADRLAALEKHWEGAYLLEHAGQRRHDAGRIPLEDLLNARYHRLQAEVRWAEARAAQTKRPR
jgi:hypothetical protein